MTLQTRQQTIEIHILPNISKSTVSQTMKCGQPIKYKMRNIFLEKSYAKNARESNPIPFYIKLKLSTSLDREPEIL